MKDRIIEMLGKGIPATQVASAVGCDDSYISQLLAEEGVYEKVTTAKAEHFAHYVEQDATLDRAEEDALQRLTSLTAFITKPAEAARVFSILNAAKRRTADTANAAQAVAATVSIELPEASRVRFTLTHDRQVIEIEGRSMATMPAKSLAARLEQRNAARMLEANIPITLPMVLPSKAASPLSSQL